MRGATIQAVAAVLLLGYLALSWVGIEAGINSLDAHGVILTVNERLRTGDFGMSRPPGHPLSEFWMLPVAAWLVDGGKVLSDEAYAYYQLAGGLFCLGVFWLLSREWPLSPARRLLAAACLVFSPQFLIESSDGEEFLWGTAFVLAAVLWVGRLGAGKLTRPVWGWCGAVACAVAASGYRAEFGGVALGIVFWTLLFSDRSWGERLGLGLWAVVLMALLWGPLWAHHGAHAPWAIPLDPKVRLAIGVYKIGFEALGVVAMIFAGIIFVRAWGRMRFVPPFGKDLLDFWLPWLVVGFFILFFLYPMKPPVILPGVAFLILWVAVRAQGWLWGCFVAACMSTLLVQVDCFDHRVWAGLKLKPGLWEQALLERPAYQGPKVAAAARLAGQGRRVVIANVWPWVFSWQREHGSWSGVALSEGVSPVAYRVGAGLVMSRVVLDDPSRLQGYAQDGYEVWVDGQVYRELFMRYQVGERTPSMAEIGGVTCRIVEMGR